MTNKQPYYYNAGEITFVKAKLLRRELTPAEKLLWKGLRNRRVDGFKFRRQHPIGPFIADFYCHAAELVIEVDGDIHDLPEVKEKDERREEYLINLGLKILRFRNEEVLVNLSTVLGEIEKVLNTKNPNPLPEERGEQPKKRG